ncbi:PhzF family phenazine biosynthesis protein [Sandaracinobacteroides hominis]|uniref:PhzF family phenazine biosynthesis protein n=1 Tax=Sandaracinobacteroides hominis TaxID=2780086 RepID=UPI0018F6D6D4|nr:PhzF family phenazine biosynthesis protein [Sandaracinobacteroides hominis]
MSFPFEIVDVFTDRAMAGNQLAVVTDARGLDGARMQAIAREFNFAETSFILPPQDPANSAQVRIFTPTEEMPFAGHPNVGTAYVAARMGSLFGRPMGDRLQFEEIAGLVVLDVLRADGGVTGARCRAPRSLSTGPEVPLSVLAELSGLSGQDFIVTSFRPCFASVGAEFILAEVTRDALERARPIEAAFAVHEGNVGQSAGFLSLHLHAWVDAGHLDVRMFAPLAGVSEDPATGSAAAALGAFLNSLDPAVTRLRMAQGRHIGRPSRIEVDAAPGEVWIGGSCAPFACGTLRA